MKQTTNFNEYNIVGDDSSLTINNSSGSLVSFTNGNLGIGTISPTEKFEVNEGFIRSTGSSIYHGFELARDTFPTYQIKHLDGGLTIYNSTDDRKEMRFLGDGRVVIDGGNVGIGTTTPSEKFEVNEGFILANGSSTNHGFELSRDTLPRYRIQHLDGGLTIFNVSDTRKEMTFKGNGRIGINNPNPAERLDVIGNIKVDGILKLYDATDTQTISLNPDGDSYINGGNVGIGTTSPTEKLDVNGNIKSSGYINGKRCGAAGYLAAPVNITVTTANTYYPIGVFTVPVAADFIVGTTYPNGLKYTGTIAQTFHITWNATVESTSNNVSSIIDIEKNGVSIPMAKMGTYTKTGGEIYNLNGQCVVDLDVNDEIRFVVTADNNGEVLTFDYFTASIKEFFD